MLRLGVTGGIGSGKSTVTALLRSACGGTVLDADAIARNVTAPGGVAIPSLRQALGAESIDEAGGLNRAYVRQRAFIEIGFRKTLESIVHPLVSQEINRIEREFTAQRTGELLIYDIPLLVESGHWRGRLDQVLVVDCSETTQVARVQARNNLSTQDIQAIIAAQTPRSIRLASADIVLFNDRISLGDLEKMTRQLSTILMLQKLVKDSE